MVDRGCIKSFAWEDRAQELGYKDSREMLEDLLLSRNLSFHQAHEIIGVSCYYKAKQLNIHTGRGRGGPNRGTSILDQLSDEDENMKVMIRNMTTKAAAVHFGVSYETVRQYKVRQGWIKPLPSKKYLKESRIILNALERKENTKPVKRRY